jgi:signal transduction histidine kinase
MLRTIMLRTLHGKLSLVLLALLCLLGVGCIALTLFTARVYNEETSQNLNRELATHLAQHLVSQNLLTDKTRTDEKTKQRAWAEITRLMVLNPDIEIYILDERGEVLGYSAKPGKVISQSVSLAPIQKFLSHENPVPIRGDDPRHPDRRKVFSAARLPLRGRSTPDALHGYMYIILGGDLHEMSAAALAGSYIMRLSVWLLVGVLLATFLVAAFLFAFLTRRLRRLADAIENFQRHLPGGAHPENGAARDEIERLENSFSQLSSRISTQVEKLERADSHRREAVSNVSHDLRTPLAALQAYLETLLMKEGRLQPEEQREYLASAFSHSERLGKLIAALFELAKLDSREMQPALEEFSLAELVQDVVQQFHLPAEKKGARLEAQCAGDLPFVRGDIGLVERLLENLIENALRHTSFGGAVTLVLQRVDGHVTVQVRDDGEGISEEDLPHIFERSYRAQNGRDETNESGSAGLGLAIAKRIAQLHDSNLQVESAPGKGATFSFDLPLA